MTERFKKLKNFLKHESVVDDAVSNDASVDNDALGIASTRKFDIKSIFSKNIKRAIIVLALIVIVATNLSFILKKIVNTQDLKTYIESEISEVIGKKAIIPGDMELEVTPEALLKIESLVIEDNNNLGSTSFIEINGIRIKPKLLELFIGKLNFNAVDIKEVSIFAKKPTGSTDNYADCLQNIKKFDESKYANRIRDVTIGKINLNIFKGSAENLISRNYSVENVSINTHRDLQFRATIPNNGVISGSLKDINENNLFVNYTDNNKNIDLNATLDKTDSIKLNGTISGNISGFDNILVKSFFPSNLESKSIATPNPFEVKSDIFFEDNKLVLPNLKISSSYFSSNTKLGITMGDELNIVADIEVPTMNAKEFFPEGFDFLYKQLGKANKSSRDEKFQLDFGDDIKISSQINFININYGENKIGGSIRFNVKGNNLELNSFNFDLPGNSIVHLTSNLKMDRETKSYSGTSDFSMVTEDSAQLFKMLDPNSEIIPNGTAKLIAIKSNIYTYEDKIHFRKIDFAFDNNKSVGQLVIDFSDNKTNAASAFNFGSINIDQFSNDINNEAASLLRKLDFIRYIDNIFDQFNISIQTSNLVYEGKNYSDFSSFITVSSGKVYFNQLQMASDISGEITGKFDIELNVFQPKLNLDLRLSNYTVGDIKENGIIFKGDWVETPINLEKYSIVTGNTKLRFDNIDFYGLPLRNLTIDMDLIGDKIKINKSRFDYLTSKFDFEGELTTQFPSLSLSFIATNLDLNKFLSKTIDNKSVTGKANLSGNFAMNGANTIQWLKSLKGAVNFTSTGVKYDGIDLTNLSQKISASSKIRDVRMWANKYLTSGNTIFTYLNGSLIIDKGIFELKDIQLNNDYIRAGKFYSKYDFVNWTADSVMDMSVKTFDKFSNVDFPVQITYKGNINNPIAERDIKGIEKYWENKFYSR
jgi:hypothetical protein